MQGKDNKANKVLNHRETLRGSILSKEGEASEEGGRHELHT